MQNHYSLDSTFVPRRVTRDVDSELYLLDLASSQPLSSAEKSESTCNFPVAVFLSSKSCLLMVPQGREELRKRNEPHKSRHCWQIVVYIFISDQIHRISIKDS